MVFAFTGLLALIARAPTILSTSPVRNFVVARINERLNGRVSVASASIGWTTGIRLTDVRVFDSADRQILRVGRFSADLSLFPLFRGRFHLGKTIIEDFDFLAERDTSGTYNFQKLIKRSGNGVRPTIVAPTRVPRFDGDFHLANGNGAFRDARTGRGFNFSAFAGDVKISDINAPIENSLKIGVATSGGTEVAQFTADGTVQLAKDDALLAPQEMTIDEKLVFRANPTAAGMVTPGSRVRFARLTGELEIKVEHQQLMVAPKNVKLASVILTTAGGAHPIGDLTLDGQIGVAFEPLLGIIAGEPTGIGQIDRLRFSNFRIAALNSSVTLNGSLESPGSARNFKNFTAGFGYDAQVLWSTIKAVLPEQARRRIGNISMDGIHTRTFAVAGNLPAHLEFEQAILLLSIVGDLEFDHFKDRGTRETNVTAHVVLSRGQVQIYWPKSVAGELDDFGIEVPELWQLLSNLSAARAASMPSPAR